MITTRVTRLFGLRYPIFRGDGLGGGCPPGFRRVKRRRPGG